MAERRTAVATKHAPSWWVVVVAGGLVIVFAVAITREFFRTRQIRQQVEQLRNQVAAEEQRHAELEDLIAYLSSPTFQEREARVQLGLKKSGEQVIIVQPEPRGESTESGSTANGTTGVGGRPVQQWWTYFFGAPTELHKTDQAS